MFAETAGCRLARATTTVEGPTMTVRVERPRPAHPGREKHRV